MRGDILTQANEICTYDTAKCVTQTVSSQNYSQGSRPLLVGISTISTGYNLLVMGGGGVCFSL